MRPTALLLVVAAAIGVVAGGRYLLRDNAESGALQGPGDAAKTGRTVEVQVDPLPAGLVQEGTFRCAELRRDDGRFTAVAEGATIRNASQQTLELAFTFTVESERASESVGREFQMKPADTAPSFLMASKSLIDPVRHCRLALRRVGPEVAQAVRAAAQRAGCTGPTTHPEEGRDHIAEGQKGTYATKPPTSGKHYARAGNTGVHTKPIPNERQVHNLEHGHVGLQYRGAGANSIGVLVDAARQSGDTVFTAPYPDMPAVIALTAWRVSVTCAKAPESGALLALVGSFIDAYKSKAPENIPGAPA